MKVVLNYLITIVLGLGADGVRTLSQTATDNKSERKAKGALIELLSTAKRCRGDLCKSNELASSKNVKAFQQKIMRSIKGGVVQDTHHVYEIYAGRNRRISLVFYEGSSEPIYYQVIEDNEVVRNESGTLTAVEVVDALKKEWLLHVPVAGG